MSHKFEYTTQRSTVEPTKQLNWQINFPDRSQFVAT